MKELVPGHDEAQRAAQRPLDLSAAGVDLRADEKYRETEVKAGPGEPETKYGMHASKAPFLRSPKVPPGMGRLSSISALMC
jgi:hypothetical protein